MATRNPANEIEFGKFNYGATMTSYTITTAAAADISAEVNVEGSSWADAAAVQTALQALSLTIAAAMTVA